jgi:glycosyltransferase involved in cell wall biosynthesis
VPDGEGGWLTAVGDIEAMTEAVLPLLRDPARWQAASDTARAHAVENFASDQIVPRYEAYYRRVLGEIGR